MGSSQRKKSSRREFLAGKAAVRAIEDALPAEEFAGAERSGSAAGSSYLVQIGRPAMACDFDVYINAGQHPGATDAAVSALDVIDALETQMTVYRPTSEVIEINRRAGRESVVVEPQLFGLLCRAVEIFHHTKGAFDITSGPLSRAWGFFRREGRFPTGEEVRSALASVGSQWIRLDQSSKTIGFDLPTLEINLNAIGKGYALDRAAKVMVDRGLHNFLFHGGQSSILARGARATDDSAEKGWWISIRHPLRTDRHLAEIRLVNRAIGTSGSGNQFFHFRGRRFGHIIDPRTGFPADRVLSATVLAPDAATADAFATAFFVLGVEESLEICSTHPKIAVLFIVAGTRQGEVEVVSSNIPDTDLRLLE